MYGCGKVFKKAGCFVRTLRLPQQEMTENAEILQEHMRSLALELDRSKPRDSILLPLMKSAYADRMAYVLNNGQISVSEIISKYPALRCLALVSIMYIYRYMINLRLHFI